MKSSAALPCCYLLSDPPDCSGHQNCLAAILDDSLKGDRLSVTLNFQSLWAIHGVNFDLK